MEEKLKKIDKDFSSCSIYPSTLYSYFKLIDIIDEKLKDHIKEAEDRKRMINNRIELLYEKKEITHSDIYKYNRQVIVLFKYNCKNNNAENRLFHNIVSMSFVTFHFKNSIPFIKGIKETPIVKKIFKRDYLSEHSC